MSASITQPVPRVRLHRWAVRLLGVAAVVLAVVAATLLAPTADGAVRAGDILRPLGFSGALMSALCVWAAKWIPLRGNPPRADTLRRHYPVQRLTGRDWFIAVAGMGLLALAVVMQYRRPTPSTALQLLLYIASSALITAGFGALRPSALLRRARRFGRANAAEVLVVGGLLMLGFCLRWWGAGETVRLLIDEQQTINPINGLWVQEVHLLRQRNEVYAYTWVHPYLHFIGVQMFGNTLGGLRSASAVFGALTIPAVWALGRNLYGRAVGVSAALVITALPLHVHFSRIAIPNVFDPLFGVLALAFVARGLAVGGRGNWAIAGFALGMTAHFHESGRLLFGPLVILLVGLVIIGRVGRGSYHSPAPLRNVRGLAITLLVVGLMAVPVLGVWATTGAEMAGRLERAGRSGAHWRRVLTDPAGPEALHTLRGARESVYLYVARPEGSLFYGGTQPLVPSFAVPLLILGFAAAVIRGRGGGPLPWLWVLGVALATGILMRHPTDAARHVVGTPAIALLLALGLWEVAGFIVGTGRFARPILVGAMLCILLTANALYYFGPHLRTYNEQLRAANSFRDSEDAMLRAMALPPSAAVHLISESTIDETIPRDLRMFLTRRKAMILPVLQGETFTQAYLDELPRDVDHAFFIEVNSTNAIAMVEAEFPLVQPSFSPYRNVSPQKQFVLLYVPAGVIVEAR